MKRFQLLAVMLLMLITSARAQTTVQGVPRQFPDTRQNVAARTLQSGSECVDFDSIQFWAGSGNDRAALVIKWPKADGTSVCLVWGYKFTGQATGLEMIEAVTQADPSLKLLTQYTGCYGNTICGIGYGDVSDLAFNLTGAKADSRIILKYNSLNVQMGQTAFAGTNAARYAADAISEGLSENIGVINHPFNQEDYGYPAYDYDYWQLPSTVSPSTLWLSGWYDGYWSYWCKTSGRGVFSYSGVGASSREIHDGYVDGWSYNCDMSNWTGASMTGDYVYVPAGGNAFGAMQSSANTRPQVRAGAARNMVDSSVFNSKHYLVHNMEEYYAAFSEIAEMGDSDEGVTIEFDASLNGQTLSAPYEDWINYAAAFSSTNVPLKIIGNGVIIDAVDKKLYIKTDKHLHVEGLTMINWKSFTYPRNDAEVTIKNCRFISCQAPFKMNFGSSANNVKIENCIYLDPIASGSTKGVFGEVTATSSDFKLEVISCTFANANVTAKNPGINLGSLKSENCKFVNCVFDNNKYGGDKPDIYVKAAGLNLGEYNIINGKVDSNIEVGETNFVGECDSVVKVEDDIAYPLATGKAYAFFPADTEIEGVVMPETDYFGTPVDYTKPVQCGAVQTLYSENEPSDEIDYTQGLFIVNEDWYGHQNSTVNFLTNDGEWIYRVVQRENPGVELGCTNQYGAIYGDRFYLIAKQDKDPGATIQGGRITICDAKTMKVLKQIPVISDAPNTDGRGFLGVNIHKGYVGTSNGIYILDLDNMEITGSISGTGNGTDDAYQGLYGGQIGSMVRVNDHVFAVHQKDGLLVINPETDKVEQTLACPEEGWGFGSIVLSKDGTLWLSVADMSGTGNAANKLVSLDPATLGMMVIDLPDGIYGPANSWYAWTPDCFCASTQHNVLYWNGGQMSWFSNKTIFKYDIDKDEFSTFIDLNSDPDGWSLYGCSFRIDPVTDDAYASLFKSFGSTDYVLRKYSDQGEILADYPMEANYWFPSIPVWPDNAEPELDIRNGLLVDEYVINLRERLTDEDNMAAAAVFTITGNTDPSVVDANIIDGVLYLNAIDNGISGVTVQANSNGKVVSTYFVVKIQLSDIETINVEEITEKDCYSIDGRRIYNGNGLQIIRMSDGSVRKVYVK